MGFLSVPNLVPSLIFIVNTLGFVTDQFCWIRLLLTASSSRFTAMGIDIGGRGVIIRGRRLFLNISVIGGDYSTEAIKRGTAIVRGKTLFHNGGEKRWGEDN